MATLAQRLEVSTTTVSKALRGLPGIGPETVRKVNDLARELNYRPNMFARGLKMSTSTEIGVLVTGDIINPWYAQMVSQLEEELGRKGYTVTLGLGKDDTAKEQRCLDAFQGRQVAGVVAGPIFHQRDLQPLWEFCQNGSPMVLFSCLDEMPVSYVGIDHVEGTKKAIDHLVEHGRRRIGYLCCVDLTMREPTRTRREGFEEGLFNHDLPLVGKDIIPGQATAKDGFRAMAELLDTRREDMPTAFFCHNDAVAMGAMRALHRAGLRVPDDVSLVGYDDIEESAICDPPLTTVGGIMDQLVPRLVEVLLHRIEHPGEALVRERILPKLIERESVAPLGAVKSSGVP
ncbi:MAG: LacI family DNA-binding transcriptional regulator [Verrucomicrobiota bacterium]